MVEDKALTSKDYYFDSYAHFGIHEEMLKDQVRTLAYRDAMLQNQHLFKDKIVLDVGCGTAILSMFAAKAGAKHVYAVDMSNIINHAKKIVAENGFENKITCIQGKLEDVVLPVKHVDIIVSEWMGYFLLYESMLPTVLLARDKYLYGFTEDTKESVNKGKIFPDSAKLFIAGLEDGQYKEEKIGYWENVYGFKMSSIQEIALHEPLVDVVEGEPVSTSFATILDIDLYTVKKADLDFETEFEVVAKRNDYVHAFVAYFDTYFNHHKTITLSTTPFAKATHWKQSVFYIKNAIPMKEDEVIKGKISVKANAVNFRDLDIQIGYKFEGEEAQLEETMDYRFC